MNKYLFGLAVLVVLVISIAAGIVFFQLKKPVYNPETASECVKIIYNDAVDKKVNIVFLSENVPQSYVKQYADALLELEPFLLQKDKVNFFYVDKPISCKVDNGALLCYSNELLKTASACHNDYIVVLSERDRRVRSSAYINVISINTAQTRTTFGHEFAHVFADIADEYVPAGLPRGQKNCVANCDKFNDLNEGCYDGCAKAELKRASENSLMRSLQSKDYGGFNKHLLNKELEKYA